MLNQPRNIFVVLFCVVGIAVILSEGSELTCRKENGEAGIYGINCKEPTIDYYNNPICEERKRKRIGKIDTCCDFKCNLNPEGVAVLEKFSSWCGYGRKTQQYYGKNYKVNIAEYPWLALLRFNTLEKHFQCTGSLITDRYILTSAKCVKGKNLLSIRLGEQNMDTNPDCESRNGTETCAKPFEEFDIEDIKYSSEHMNLHQDLALIKLDAPVVFKDHIKPICLPLQQNAIEINFKKFTIAGWGTTEEGYTSSILERAIVTHKYRHVCKKYFKGVDISNYHICVKGTDKTSYCHGDSGGPVFFPWGYKSDNRPRNILYGIITVGLGRKYCKNETNPVLFTNVVQMMPWITNNIL